MRLNQIFERLDKDVKDLIKGSGTTFIIRVLGVLLLYVFTVIITNTWGDDVYGEFAFFVLSLKLISLLATAGLDTYLLRYISDNPEEKNISKLIGNGTIAILFNSLFIGVVIYFLSQNYYEVFFSEYWYITLLILGIFPLSIAKMNAQSFRAKKSATMYSIVEFTGIPFFAILFFYSLNKISGPQSSNAVFAYFLGVVTMFVISLFKWQFKYGIDILKNSGNHIKQTLSTNKLALPFLIAASSIHIGQWSVSLFLKYFEGNGALGNFDAAFRVGFLLMLPMVASLTIAAPLFSRKYAQGDLKGLEKILKLITNWMFFITTPLMIFVFIFSNQIMGLFGPDFAESGNILRILLLGYFFNAITGPVSLMLQMAEKQVLVQNVFLASTVLNIIISFILIPKFGVIGACWSNVIYQIVLNGYLLIYLKVKFGYLSFGR